MDPEKAQTIAARDQLWASLRLLRAEIDQLAQGEFGGSEREQQIITLLARVVSAELGFRAEETGSA
ncbi:MAG TPA: hypothetical protein VKU02_05985 [Gemmataceae bacterium]|nr:hypothetical protein [Gemmataceae bacterium]